MFQDFAKETFSSLLVATLGHQNVQNIAILINCSPQVDLPALNPQEEFINVPNITQPTLLPSDRLGVLRSELETPAANSLIGNDDTALRQQILDVSKAKGEPMVEPDGTTDDFTQEAMAAI